MQTFLPYDDFARSASALDNRRLGKQRVEAFQILNTLCGFSSGWRNHPAVKMWRGHEFSLYEYAQTTCAEWIRRGFNDTVSDKLRALPLPDDISTPVWLGDEAVHASHRANLMRKAPEWYGQFGWDEDPALPYVWPVK